MALSRKKKIIISVSAVAVLALIVIISVVATRKDVYVGESDEEAEAVCGPYLEKGHRGGYDRSALIYGGPETVAAKFREYAGMGFTEIVTRNLLPDQPHVIASLERLAEVRERVLDA